MKSILLKTAAALGVLLSPNLAAQMCYLVGIDEGLPLNCTIDKITGPEKSYYKAACICVEQQNGLYEPDADLEYCIPVNARKDGGF